MRFDWAKIIAGMILLAASSWFFMLLEGIIAAPHHIYTIGYGESILGFVAMSLLVNYLAFEAKGAIQNV